jgi:hypothetical protein
MDALDVAGGARDRPATPTFRYTVPTFYNPAGGALSVERRAEVLAIRREYGVAVVTYPTLRSLHTLAAGLRVGLAARTTVGREDRCQPPNRRPPARRVSPGCWSRGTGRRTRGAVR